MRPHAKSPAHGDGGDDFFLGYPYHNHMAVAQRMARSLPPGSASLWKAVRPPVNSIGMLAAAQHLMDYATGGLGAVTQTHDGLPYFECAGLLGKRLEGCSIASRRIPLSHASAKNLLRDLIFYDLKTVFRGEYLPKVDGTTLFCGIEARSPFLDYRMAELALSLPEEVRLHRGELKAVLRELARRRLGKTIAERPKRGFTIPIEDWLAVRCRDQLQELGPHSLIAEQGWINGARLQSVIAAAASQPRMPLQIWHLLVLENWLGKISLAENAALACPSAELA